MDKYLRLMHGWPWFASEQPDDTIRAVVEHQLDKVHWTVDGVLSHTVPLAYEPTWALIKVVSTNLSKHGWAPLSRNSVTDFGSPDTITLKATKDPSRCSLIP